MRKLFLLLTGLLLGGALSAQSISRCEYWFDQDYANRQDAFVVGGVLQWQANATSLGAGLHRLNLHVQDTSGVWSSPRSFQFLHLPTPQSAAATYTCWFDNNTEASQTGTLANGMLLVDASTLTPGLHSYNIVCHVGNSTRVEQRLFFKVPDGAEATLTFHYRVDGADYQSVTAAMQGELVNLNIDMIALDEGSHNIEHYTTNGVGDILSPIQLDTFFRTHIPVHYTLNALSADETMGTVEGGGSWLENTEVTLTAIPNDGYHFTQWSDGDTVNPRTFTITSDTTFTAYFAANPQYVELSRCEYWFDQDYANRQNAFVVDGNLQWYADASSLSAGLHKLNLHIQDVNGVWSSPRSFNFLHIPTLPSVPATYTYWLDNDTTNIQNGTLTGQNMMVDASALTPGVHSYTVVCQIGTNRRVEQHLFYKMPETTEATAMTFHYRIDGGDFQTATATMAGATVNLDLDMTALDGGSHTIEHYTTNGNNDILSSLKLDNFICAQETVMYTVTVLSADESMGTVSEGGTWAENEQVTITAYPIDGYHFTQWNDGVTDNPRTFVITSDTTFTAYFEQDIHYYTVTVLSADETMGTVSEGGTWAENEQVTITAYPNDGYLFSHWNDNDADTTNPRTFIITSDTTFTAYFDQDIQYYTLTVLSDDETMGTVSEGGTWAEGEQVTMTAIPNSGYHFTHWNDGDTTNPRTFIITSDTTFKAFFEADIQYYTLTVLSDDEAKGIVTGGGLWMENERVTITAIPNNGFLFSQWNDNDTTNPRLVTLTSDTTFIAYFVTDPVGIGEHSMEQLKAYGYCGNIIVSLDTPQPLWVYDMEGRLLLHKPVVGAGTYSIPVPHGIYAVKVGEYYIQKVVVTE